MLALLRPGEWDLPLYVHVAGAMLLVGSLTVAASALVGRWRRPGDAAVLTRLATWALGCAVASWIVMRVGAEWIASKWGFEEDPDWVTVGRVTADLGGVVLLVSLGLSIAAMRRADRPSARTLARVAGALSVVLILALLVSVWAMTTKRV